MKKYALLIASAMVLAGCHSGMGGYDSGTQTGSATTSGTTSMDQSERGGKLNSEDRDSDISGQGSTSTPVQGGAASSAIEHQNRGERGQGQVMQDSNAARSRSDSSVDRYNNNSSTNRFDSSIPENNLNQNDQDQSPQNDETQPSPNP